MHGFLRHGRLYLRDEPEDLLIRDLPKALRANPEMLKSDNEDLREFMKAHFPDGVNGKVVTTPSSPDDGDSETR